jgi:hypothetical protein
LKAGLILTKRDLGLLRALYQHTFLSFDQVMRFHFRGNSKATVSNRLAKLLHAGFIRKLRVGTVIYHSGPKTIGTILTLTNQALIVLRATEPSEKFLDQVPRISTLTLHHDLLLIECSERLKAFLPDVKVVNARLLGLKALRDRQLPDAVIEVPRRSTQMAERPWRFAIELELSQKSERRYREIILNYRMSNEFDGVLYIHNGNGIREKIQSVILGYKTPSGLAMQATGTFYFAELNEFLREGPRLVMSNGELDLWDYIIEKTNWQPQNKTQNGVLRVAP